MSQVRLPGDYEDISSDEEYIPEPVPNNNREVINANGTGFPVPVIRAPGGPPGQDKSVSIKSASDRDKTNRRLKSVVVVANAVRRKRLRPSTVSVAQSGRTVEVHPGLEVTVGGKEGEMPESIGSDVRDQPWYQDYIDSIREVPAKYKDYCRECKSSICEHCLPPK